MSESIQLLEQIPLSTMSDEEITSFLAENKIGLTVAEAKKIEQMVGRAPTLTECVIWGIQGSEHSSYRSSWKELKKLPKKAANVVLAHSEDAGVVEFARVGDEKYCIVISHESHNHPSQVVPYEGAATGIGGNVRDVCCMGARVIANADALRFGEPNKNSTKVIAEGVVSGIAGYGNPIGIPNLGGDVYFNSSNDANCLVNAVTLGLVKEHEIIHSYAPADSIGHDIIVVGKATDNSGMGGAAFASTVLDESDKEANKGAVQEPNPFLKRHLLNASYALFSKIRSLGLTNQVGFKDMGAGGIMCATVELADAAGVGAEIDIEKIHANGSHHPSVIACAETQERFAWVVPQSLTPLVLSTYNDEYALPSVSEGARASVVGRICDHNRYVLRHNGTVLCDAKTKDITAGLRYYRESKEANKELREPYFAMPNLNTLFIELMGSQNICSRRAVFEKYDKQVQGNVVLEAGLADAGVVAPLAFEEVPERYKKLGLAFSVDGNPRYGRISPYWQAALAAAESMRNVASVGAEPLALTDCCNYGNPEVAEEFWEFCEGVRGLDDACRFIGQRSGDPLVPVAGNVSFYNYSSTEGSIDPCMIVSCIGKIHDCGKLITPVLKGRENLLFLIGERRDECGGSEYYSLLGHVGANVPTVQFGKLRKEINTVLDCVDKKIVLSCHDISEGGVLACVAEMCLGPYGMGSIGVQLQIDKNNNNLEIRADKWLFSQTGGFVLEVSPEYEKQFRSLCAQYDVDIRMIGTTTTEQKITVRDGSSEILKVPLVEIAHAWLNGYKEVLK